MKENISNHNRNSQLTACSLQFQKGVSLFLVVVISAVLLGIALGLSSILIVQIRTVGEMRESVTAFYAADTGIERELYERNSPPHSYSDYLDLNNNGIQDGEDASYYVVIIAPGPSCDASHLCIQSRGTFREVQRAIEVKY